MDATIRAARHPETLADRCNLWRLQERAGEAIPLREFLVRELGSGSSPKDIARLLGLDETGNYESEGSPDSMAVMLPGWHWADMHARGLLPDSEGMSANEAAKEYVDTADWGDAQAFHASVSLYRVGFAVSREDEEIIIHEVQSETYSHYFSYKPNTE